ncbi:MAG: dockerin type I repeat-containing protein [Armatimonadetes bacterium]|nr:dockerin type I repeat-containing protein [Armatimonadota bacterium]
MKSTFRIAALMAACTNITIAFAHGDTLDFSVDSSRLVTGLMSEITGVVTPSRVFGSEFVWNAASSVFRSTTPGHSWGLDLQSGDPLRISLVHQVWEYNGAELVPTDQRVAVSYLANQISSASGPGPSFDYAIPASHYHFAYTLPGLPENATPSVYVLACETTDLSHGFGATQPYFIVFNLGQDETVHDAAIDLVTDELGSSTMVRSSVSLGGFTGNLSERTVQVDVREMGSTSVVESHTCGLSDEGGFTFFTNLQGSFDLAIRSNTFLRKVVRNVEISTETVNKGNVSLVGGDVDGDNQVTIFDYLALSDAFDSSAGDSAWNPNADLDGDGSVTVFDYLILSDSFDQQGDE